MFVREPFKAPPGATTSHEVRYSRGRKPFGTLPEANAFAKAERASGGWASINQIITIEVEKRK